MKLFFIHTFFQGLELLKDNSNSSSSSSKKSVKSQLELCRAQSAATASRPKSQPELFHTFHTQLAAVASRPTCSAAKSTTAPKSVKPQVDQSKSQNAAESDPNMATIATLIEVGLI